MTDQPSANHHEASTSHQNFMQVVYLVNNIACLFGRNPDGSLTAEYVTPSFVTLMECASQEEALALMDGDRLYERGFFPAARTPRTNPTSRSV